MFRKLAALLIGISVLTAVSCSEFKQVQKSTDIQLKYQTAVKLYEKQDYDRALQLLDELLIYYRGNDTSEKINYYYAYCYYGQGEYIEAGYYFLKFTTMFPTSQYAEECLYMSAYCQYLFTPDYSLDQSISQDAIRQFQYFIDKYPKSERISDCNRLIDELRAKLERKAYEIAKLYYQIESYQAAAVAFKNLLREYPDTKYREDAYYYITKASYHFAMNSVESKKAARFGLALDAYNAFITIFPESTYLKEINVYQKNITKELEKLNAKKS